MNELAEAQEGIGYLENLQTRLNSAASFSQRTLLLEKELLSGSLDYNQEKIAKQKNLRLGLTPRRKI